MIDEKISEFVETGAREHPKDREAEVEFDREVSCLVLNSVTPRLGAQSE